MGFKNNKQQKLGLHEEGHYGIEKRYNYIFNSNNGALLKPPNKALFNVSFTSTINLPSDASSIQVGLHSANIVNNVPNITTELYNTITFIINGDKQTITLPQGSYSACDIQKAINAGLEDAYPLIQPPPTITILGNDATQTLSIQFNFANGQIVWGESTLGFVLGFDTTATQPTNPSFEGEIIEADEQARLNWAITNFVIICNELVGDGLPLNNVGLGIVGAIPIIADPGSLIAYEAINPLWIQCDNLVGQNISSLTFELANERGELITMTEDFNFVIVIKVTY